MKKWAKNVDGIREPSSSVHYLVKFLFNASTYYVCGKGDVQVICICRE